MFFIHKMGWPFQKVLYPHLTWRIPTEEKKIFLTFDDGPIPEVTPFVLDTLKRYDAKATFFCVGDNIRKHPEVFEAVLEGGHAVGNHTFNHLVGWNTSLEKYLENTERCQDWIERFDKKAASAPLFRPPHGRISQKQIKALQPKYRIVMWEVLSGDFEAYLKKETCLQKSIQYAKPGSIVVFHDSVKAKERMYYALPHFIDHFAGQGYTFEKIS